jgi:predicted nuclease of predicted toxin-antitoxin system
VLNGKPEKLLIVATGNIRNKQLFALFNEHWPTIVELFQTCRKVIMSNTLLFGQ